MARACKHAKRVGVQSTQIACLHAQQTKFVRALSNLNPIVWTGNLPDIADTQTPSKPIKQRCSIRKMINLKEAALDLQTCIKNTPDNSCRLKDAPKIQDNWRKDTTVTLKPWDDKFTLIQPRMPNIGMINLFDRGFDTDILESYIQSRWNDLQRQTGLKLDTVARHEDKIKSIEDDPSTNLDQLKDFLSLVKNTMQFENQQNSEEDIQQIQKEISYDMINIVRNNPPKKEQTETIIVHNTPPEKEQTQTNAEKNKLGSDLTTTWITIGQLINHALNLL